MVKGVGSVINGDQGSRRAQLVHYTPLNSFHEQIRHNEAQLLHIHSHSTVPVPFSHNTHTSADNGLIFTVDCDAGLWLVILARHLPDVEGLGGRVGQEAEHQDDRVGAGKTVRVDLSVRETKRDDMSDLL